MQQEVEETEAEFKGCQNKTSVLADIKDSHGVGLFEHDPPRLPLATKLKKSESCKSFSRRTSSTAPKGCARYLQSLLGIPYPEERCQGQCTREHSTSRPEAPADHSLSVSGTKAKIANGRPRRELTPPSHRHVTYNRSGKGQPK